MPYVRVELEQGTPDWLAWRHDGIGGSEAPAVMGESPWKSRNALLAEKCRPPCGGRGNGAMQKGQALEPKARDHYVARCGLAMHPVCIQSRATDWLRASLDGLSACGQVAVEIKCGAKAYELTAKTRTVPRYYYGQLQHIMAAGGLEGIDFCCFWPGEPLIILPVARDVPYIARMLEAEQQFWADVQARRAAACALPVSPAADR